MTKNNRVRSSEAAVRGSSNVWTWGRPPRATEKAFGTQGATLAMAEPRDMMLPRWGAECRVHGLFVFRPSSPRRIQRGWSSLPSVRAPRSSQCEHTRHWPAHEEGRVPQFSKPGVRDQLSSLQSRLCGPRKTRWRCSAWPRASLEQIEDARTSAAVRTSHPTRELLLERRSSVPRSGIRCCCTVLSNDGPSSAATNCGGQGR